MLSSSWRKISHRMAVTGIALCAFLALAGLAGARFNMTNSLPLGLYWVTGGSIARNSYVRFCPPAIGAFAEAMKRGYLHRGHCPSGYVPMLKRVSGVAGDVIDISPPGVYVNGAQLPLSQPRKMDGLGRLLPWPDSVHMVLKASQLWVMSDTNDRSFDSRYFGPIDQSWVKDVIRPVFTWGRGGTLERMSPGSKKSGGT